MEKAFTNALSAVEKKSAWLKTTDLVLQKTYKFKQMRCFEESKYGPQLVIFLKHGKYSLPQSTGNELLRIYKKNPQEYKKLVETGVKSQKSLRLKLVSFKGKNKNSPRFQIISTPPVDEDEESSDDDDMMAEYEHPRNPIERDNDDDDDLVILSDNVLANSSQTSTSSLWHTMDFNKL